MPKKIAIIGSGAIGAFYGARLLASGQEVHFLFHSDIDHVRRHGLRVDSVDGDMFFPEVNAYGSAEKMPVCDLVIVATKSTQNHLLANLLRPVCNENTTVLLLQNGLNGERLIHDMGFGGPVLGGLCFVCCNKLGPGHIAHLENGKIIIGQYRKDEQPAGRTEVQENVAVMFEKAGIPIDRTPDLILSRWHKLLWNMPFNGLCALLNATTDQVMANQATRDLAYAIMQETQAGARALGRDLPDATLDAIMEFTDTLAPYKPSMMLDAINRRDMELEGIYGEPIRTAAEHGVEMPRSETLYRELQFLNASYRE
jgi:2-dehydropantoate 2-reductase